MRVKLEKEKLQELFARCDKKIVPRLAVELNVSLRSVRDWKRGVLTMPETAYQKLLTLTGFTDAEIIPKRLENYWYVTLGASKGGISRQKLHGNLGTPEGRRLGGLRSIETHKRLGTHFSTLKSIPLIEENEELMELLGIIAGDGHLSKYQIMVATSSVTDVEHAKYTRYLLNKIFKMPVLLTKRRDSNCLNIILSSMAAVQFINSSYGFPIGNKIKKQIQVPQAVFRSDEFQKAFLRGLFDTDGCIYKDKHRYKDRVYISLGWNYTSHSAGLLMGAKKILTNLGFRPTQNNKWVLLLRRKEDIRKYFIEVGTSNIKHLMRYNKFGEECESG